MTPTNGSPPPAAGPAADPAPIAPAGVCAAHRAARARFGERARALSDVAWRTPRAPDAWTPAQETAHLTLSYALFTAALRGGAAALRLPLERSLRLQAAVLPGIVAGREFPTGVQAPPETVPPADPGSAPEVTAALADAAEEFERAVVEAHVVPGRRAVHPYLGPMRPVDLLALSVAHTEHHAGHLPVSPAAPGANESLQLSGMQGRPASPTGSVVIVA